MVPVVSPKNTKLPRSPSPTLSSAISYLSTNVAAGMAPWSMLMSRLQKNINKYKSFTTVGEYELPKWKLSFFTICFGFT